MYSTALNQRAHVIIDINLNFYPNGETKVWSALIDFSLSVENQAQLNAKKLHECDVISIIACE